MRFKNIDQFFWLPIDEEKHYFIDDFKYSNNNSYQYDSFIGYGRGKMYRFRNGKWVADDGACLPVKEEK